MVSNDKRRRQLAREKAERQEMRREAARRKVRRRNAAIAGVIVVAMGAGAAVAAAGALGGDGGGSDERTEPTPTPTRSEPPMAVDTKARYTMTVKTDRGDIRIAMDAAKTPRTVNSFKKLADEGYFDRTTCHRLTTQNIHVLQCGDPQGTGMGNPGYTIPDENLGGLGKPGKDGKVTFPAGTVAMANTSRPDSGGSQFFLVYKDSRLTPTFTPFGTMDAGGLETVRKVGAAGVAGGGGDGAPELPVAVEKISVTKD
ncbi:peptidylprolyl isomerase [Streptomyces pactum]|uniref:Peptidylprolyl isomerase n=1 Tax=Streptomyces pactum TaxID=68249 RepID=A0ABS0NRW8_9ACTN|nr:peptidylprolyl isomerase [Streptomyces pactum]MBH5337950.1 peptidylprolyl isomerase [Streptomyces pactum]